MSLIGLTQYLAGRDDVSSVATGRGAARVYGLLSAAKPAVVAAMAARPRLPILVVTAHMQSASEFVEEIVQWSDLSVSLFPAIESLPYERVRLDRTRLGDREAVAYALKHESAGIVVAPVRALLQPIEAPRAMQPSQTVRAGEHVVLDRLIARWVQIGYADVSSVTDPGTFARRGGVVDIFVAGAEYPVRIELFGNDIESLRAFDPSTQRSVHPVDSLTVTPLVTLDEDTRLNALVELMDINAATMNAESRTRWLDDLARLEAGASFDDLSVFSPYLVTQACSLLECVPDSGLVVIDGPTEVRDIVDDLWNQATAIQEELVTSGDLPAGLKPALFPPEYITAAMRTCSHIEFEPGSPQDSDALDWGRLFTPAGLYAGRLRTLTSDLKEVGRHRIVIATAQHERLAELMRDEGLPARQESTLTELPAIGVTLVPSVVREGWILPSADVTVLSDHELFGRATIRSVPRKPRPTRDVFFGGFAPGDHVVHIEHGIGRFEGMTRMILERVEREYALVQYAGTDRLYVPTDQLERLTRYVGVGDTPPPLNKLGGGEWQRARGKAKEAAAEVARELIDLYAKRMARPGHAFEPDSPWQRELESSFPYPETPDQLRAVADVKRDMEQDHPMDRLVCADVGYGKTEVAVRAAFKAVMDGMQVAVLVPTTILAQQHFETFSERYGAFPVKVEVLSRFRTPTQQKEILRRAASGEVDVVIGTHRLLSKDVHFKKLGLLVVDEEQRFGVRHKEQLKKLRESIDVLTLTATPIPRTLNMGLVGIREISVIETPPEGRLPIKTYLQPFDERAVRDAVLRELDRDGQVYIVHNKVATIDALAERVRRLVPEARVVVGHGQMDEAQLERVMMSFAHHEADVLVCSTIIENGLDIPNVNTIVVNHAHRLGLTQLYQLRGRVGRSPNQAYAYLLYPRDVRLTHDAGERLEAVFEAQDLGAGFNIAMRDLEIRGAGNLLGAEQSGYATAIGFDLYTRMIGDAVEHMRGTVVEEPPLVSIDLPLTMYIPPEYVNDEAERLTLYRRLALIADHTELDLVREEILDRFGQPPEVVENLLTSVRIKLMAIAAHVESVSLGGESMVVRARNTGLFDRVSLYRSYAMHAKISSNVLRIPRRKVGDDWQPHVENILGDMMRLREALNAREPVGA